jgi:hypothetical protein
MQLLAQLMRCGQRARTRRAGAAVTLPRELMVRELKAMIGSLPIIAFFGFCQVPLLVTGA